MPDNRLTRLTGDIVSAFVERNPVSIAELPHLIRLVHGALDTPLAEGAAQAGPPKHTTPAQIRRSITRDALISFEDGRPYAMLRRHLRTHGLTPEEYRAKWGLPSDYPMVAPGYSAKRSEVAKAAGLGTRTRGATAQARKAR